KVRAGPAHHRAAAVAAAEAERDFGHRRDDDDALSRVEQVFRDVVRDVEHLLHHDAAVFEAALFLVGREDRGRSEDDAEGDGEMTGHDMASCYEQDAASVFMWSGPR